MNQTPSKSVPTLVPPGNSVSKGRSQRILLLGLCLFLACLSIQYFLKIHHGTNRSAFLRWSNQIQDLWQGENIWDKHQYPNPPIMALILTPFACLPHLAGPLAWFIFKAGLTLLAVRGVWNMLDSPERPFPTWAKILSLILILKPIEGDMVHGNVNLFILFLLTVSLGAFTRRRDLFGGVVLGLAIACKLTPALFVPYFAWKRAWKFLAGCTLGLFLFLGVVPSLCLGVKENTDFLATWLDNMVLPYVVDGKVTSEHQNQSLPGVLHRLLTPSPSFSQRTETDYIPLDYHHIADLDPSLVQLFVKILMGCFVGLVIWCCQADIGSSRKNWRLLAEFSVIILGMLLFSERTWKHHAVTLLFPCSVVAYGLSFSRNQEPGARKKNTFSRLLTPGSWLLIGAGILMLSTSTGLFPSQNRFGDLAQVYGAYLWAFLMLLAAVVILLRSRPAEVKEPGAEIYQIRVSVQSPSSRTRTVDLSQDQPVAKLPG